MPTEEGVQSEQSGDQGQAGAAVADPAAQSNNQAIDQGAQPPEAQSQEPAKEGADNSGDQGTQEPAVFMSKDDVPPELLPQWERMNKTFTTGMQGQSQDRKDAQAFRDLQEQQIQSAQAQPQPQKQQEQLANEMGVDMENLTPEQKQTMDWLNGYVAKQVQQHVQPINQQFVQDRTTRELEQVRLKYGDSFTQREPEIAQTIQKSPGLNYEQAYQILTYDEQHKAGLNKAYENVEGKKKAKVSKSTPSGAVADSPNLDSVSDIFQAAKREHGYS